ncbi:TlpA family protein disulfide reductase [Paucihalobacter ruber]|uniref:TlpA family protein disulfide reductase n=1 Tax=Paucihalobacter ruber TaxID=2567861 RepID=A0A506PN26_9FLAO|nr:TlpA disulfide reductase family protein [Paucihalobacter ruber]TPV34672.1 TlpA family protein disulfide reductase [Paucihalobacter ruber]
MNFNKKSSLSILLFIFITFFLIIRFYPKEKTKITYLIGHIDEKYFEINQFESEVVNMKGTIETIVTYPHAYRYLLEKDKGVYPFRKGYYFIDTSTKSIIIDTLFNACTDIVYSDSNQEYKDKFIPYHYKNSFENCSNVIENVYFNRSEDDVNLNNYILENPDSYVALWHLIERVSFRGYLDIRKTALYNFSNELKQSKIWKLLEADLSRLEKYAVGNVLPKLKLKNDALKEETLDFSSLDAEYTLVELWFSRCKPCHKAFEVLIPMQEKYKSKGFNIIGISTDVTDEIPLWQKTLDKYQFEWQNYLDENSAVAKEMNISSFPSNFLLDQNGVIIKVNITPKDLEIFLANSL